MPISTDIVNRRATRFVLPSTPLVDTSVVVGLLRSNIQQRDALHKVLSGQEKTLTSSSRLNGAASRNWLPAPAGRFMLITRMYWRKAEPLDSRWTAPAVQRVN